MIRLEKPEAILVTMSKLNVEEWGGIDILDRFFHMRYSGDSDSTFWYKVGKNLPVHQDLLYIYLVIDNVVRWRFNYVCFETKPEGIELFKNGSLQLFKGNFVVMAGPAVKANDTISYKGFQGFRYSQVIY